MSDLRIISVEWAMLDGTRPRTAGCNARLGVHGLQIHLPLARLTTAEGITGFGWCRIDRQQATALLGQTLDDLFTAERGVVDPWLAFEYPIWDLAGQQASLPVYALATHLASGDTIEPLWVPCYDTSLYFDDLQLTSTLAAADLIAAEAHQGYERGHRAFKIKVGRGARHMPLEEGTHRDIAVIQAVRSAVGPEVPLMIDANNGYNLNITKRVLAETAACRIFWLEEPFHEDPVLYADLRDWLNHENLPILIADGEGQASPSLLNWAADGLIDVIQYDIFGYGLTRWLSTGRQLDAQNTRSAPHHYGGHYGNYAAGHLAAAIRGFTYVEWDEATTPGLDTSRYRVQDGHVIVPAVPGFGLDLDDALFRRAVQSSGFRVSL